MFLCPGWGAHIISALSRPGRGRGYKEGGGFLLRQSLSDSAPCYISVGESSARRMDHKATNCGACDKCREVRRLEEEAARIEAQIRVLDQRQEELKREEALERRREKPCSRK